MVALGQSVCNFFLTLTRALEADCCGKQCVMPSAACVPLVEHVLDTGQYVGAGETGGTLLGPLLRNHAQKFLRLPAPER